jgi:DNA-binding transcriptional MerR regulator
MTITKDRGNPGWRLAAGPSGGGLSPSDALGRARSGKAAGAFRTISEVATDLNVPQHVLRFWETRFAQIRPLKRAGGRRYYRPEDIELLRRIRELLYNNGYTIKGVQRLLRDAGGGRRPDGDEGTAIEAESDLSAEVAEEDRPPLAADAPSRDVMETAISDLQSIRELLKRVRR